MALVLHVPLGLPPDVTPTLLPDDVVHYLVPLFHPNDFIALASTCRSNRLWCHGRLSASLAWRCLERLLLLVPPTLPAPPSPPNNAEPPAPGWPTAPPRPASSSPLRSLLASIKWRQVPVAFPVALFRYEGFTKANVNLVLDRDSSRATALDPSLVSRTVVPWVRASLDDHPSEDAVSQLPSLALLESVFRNLTFALWFLARFNVVEFLPHAALLAQKRADGGKKLLPGAVFTACEHGSLEALTFLHNLMPSALHADARLRAASAKGQLHLVRWLLGNRQVQISQELLDDAFCKACAGGHLDTVKHFFETAGLRQSPNNRRGVVSACENGRTEVVQYFLEPRFAPLSLFGESGRCRPEAFNRFCDCPLVCAVEKRQTDVVRLLVLQAPADFAGSGPARPAPPATLSSGLDPRVHKDLALMVAIENESAVLIRLLVAAVGPQAVLENASSVEYRLRHRPCAAATLIDLGFRDLFDEDAVENLHDQGHLDTLLVLFEKGVVEVTEKWVARARKFEWLSLLKEVAGDAVETVLQEMRWWEGGR